MRTCENVGAFVGGDVRGLGCLYGAQLRPTLPSRLELCRTRLLAVDGGGEPGYDHCFARVPAGGAYDAAAGESEIARCVLVVGECVSV